MNNEPSAPVGAHVEAPNTRTRDRLEMVIRNMEKSLAATRECLKLIQDHPEMDESVALTFLGPRQ